MSITIDRSSMAQQQASTRATAIPCFSDPGRVDLCAYRGDDGRVRLTITDADGAPLDVSAATWDADIRLTEDTATVLAQLVVEPVVGEPSQVDLVLTNEESVNLNEDAVYDVEMTLGGQVTTLIYGRLIVRKDVSRP